MSRPTPETDDQPTINAINDNGYQIPCVDIEFARKLERERDEWYFKAHENFKFTLDARAERDEARMALEEETKFHHRTHAELIQTQCRLTDVTQAIIATLEENRHLADGDDCTLAKLKSVVPEWK